MYEQGHGIDACYLSLTTSIPQKHIKLFEKVA